MQRLLLAIFAADGVARLLSATHRAGYLVPAAATLVAYLSWDQVLHALATR